MFRRGKLIIIILATTTHLLHLKKTNEQQHNLGLTRNKLLVLGTLKIQNSRTKLKDIMDRKNNKAVLALTTATHLSQLKNQKNEHNRNIEECIFCLGG